jgi:hypothetical protein
MPNEITAQGDLVILTQGEYSDYGLIAHYRANETIVWKEQLERYLETFPTEREPYSADIEKFPAWLTEQNLLTKIEVQEVHLGSYSSWSL